jgi:hypothetical protein
MTIEQTLKIPPNHSITIELPRSIPAGVLAQVSITIPTASEGQRSTAPTDTVKSLRGILKGKGITLERFREMQREDKALEEASG